MYSSSFSFKKKYETILFSSFYSKNKNIFFANIIIYFKIFYYLYPVLDKSKINVNHI